MKPTEKEKQELNERSMQMILHSGNAREKVMAALSLLATKDYLDAGDLLVEARKEITAAHNFQTGMLQKEANEEPYYYSLLFSHAQDTLMTVQSEALLAEKLVDIINFHVKEQEQHNEEESD